MALNERSTKALDGVHPDLIKVVELAHDLCQQNSLDFVITEGCRTLARQRQLVASGASKTLKSRHIPGTGGFSHAVDFAPIAAGEITWKWPAFEPIAAIFKVAAAKLGVKIEWGGDWRTFRDGPHVQLPWKDYP